MKMFKELLPYIIILVCVILIRCFVVTPVKVDGSSMSPNLHDGEILLLKKYDKSFDRFDVVVFDYESSRLVKRIIGLPGEVIYYKNNHLFINGQKIDLKDYEFETEDFELSDLGYKKIPKDHYFVMGDNRYNSKDSRIIGPISEDELIGVTNYRIWPFSKFGKIN